MNKLFNKIATGIVGIALAIGAGVAVEGIGSGVTRVHAGEVEFTPSNCTNWSSSQESQTQTISGITLSSTSAANSTQLRLYASNTHTITSTVGNITKVVFTCTGSGTGSNGPGKMSLATGSSGKYSYNQTIGTWTGNATTFSLYGGQTRCTKITVTYSGGSTPYTTTINVTGGAKSTVTGHESTSFSSAQTSGYVYLTPSEGYQMPSPLTTSTFSVTGGTASITAAQAVDGDVRLTLNNVSANFTISGSFAETPSSYIKDVITAADLTATGNSYTAFSNVAKTSDARYLGRTATDGDNIQLNSGQTSSEDRGIGTSVSGGTIKSVSVSYGSGGGNALTVRVSNSPYTATNIQSGGTALASTLSSSNTKVTVTGDYTYVSVYRASSGATWPASLTFEWDPGEQYNITYKDKGGDDFSGTHETGYPTKHTYGKETTLKSASNTGYIFDGWFDNINCTGTKLTKLGATTYSADITLYAKWTAKTSNLTFDLAEGAGTAPTGKVATYGLAMPAYGESAPTKEGHTFGGFYDGTNGSGTQYYNAGLGSARNWDKDITSGTTLHAYWIVNAYAVDFDVQGHGTAPADQSINYGGKVTEPTAPTADGYIFKGWFKESTCKNAWNFNTDTVSGKTTLYASWAVSFSVTFNVQGHGTAPDPQNVEAGLYAEEPTAPVDTGYTFGGWYKESLCTNAWDFANDKVNANTVLYAKWTVNSYTVTFNVQGHGTAPAEQTVDYGKLVSRPTTPSEPGFEFGGWYKESGCINLWNFDEDTISGNTIIYAKWTIASYRVLSGSAGLNVSTVSILSSGGDVTLTTAARKKGTDVSVSGTATYTISGNVISFTSVLSDVTISANIVDATPTLNVTGQKTSFTLEESFSFDGIVTKTYDDWVSPHTTDTIAPDGYTVDSSNFVEGVEGTYSITVSHTGAQNYVYEVTVVNIQEKTDVITADYMQASGGTYETYTFNGNSSSTAYESQNAVYATGGINYLQYRSKNNNSGLVNTNSKGKVKSIKITWRDTTGDTQNYNDGKTVIIYGSNSAYNSPADLYNASTYGDNITSYTYDADNLTNEYIFEGDYTYIGLRSNSGALYLAQIEITWLVVPRPVDHIGSSGVTETGPFYVGTKPTLDDLGITVTAYYDEQETESEDVSSLATILYPASGLTDDNNGGLGYTITYGGKTTTVDITAEVADVYTKLTSVTDLIVGSVVRIATDSYVMSSSAYSSQLLGISGDPTDASLEYAANMIVGADSNGYYFSIVNDSTTLYLTGSSDTNLSFSTTLNLSSHWNVTIGNSGVARIFNASYTDREIRQNNSNHRFASYKNAELAVSIYQLVDNEMTEEEKIAAQIDTFGKLYLHKEDIAISEETRSSDGTACNGYYDKAKAALSGDWSPIQEELSKDTSGMWERYCSWAWVTYRETPSYSNGQMQYSRPHAQLIDFIVGDSSQAIIVALIISATLAAAIGGYFFLRKKKED